MPVITILIRHHNNTSGLGPCFSSALSQQEGFKHAGPKPTLEIIVIDDGSSKAQLERLKKILTQFENIKLLSLTHQGPIAALNRGLKASEGEWFTVLDSDDQLPKESLAHLWNPQSDFTYGDYLEFQPRKQKIFVNTETNIFNTLAGGILFRKSAVLTAGGYDESLFFPEYDLLLKLGADRGQHIPKIVYHYHRRHDSMTGSKAMVLKGREQLYKKYGRVIPIREYSL